MSFCDKHSPLINSIPNPSQQNHRHRSPVTALGSDPFAHRGPLWAWIWGDMQTHVRLPSPGGRVRLHLRTP